MAQNRKNILHYITSIRGYETRGWRSDRSPKGENRKVQLNWRIVVQNKSSKLIWRTKVEDNPIKRSIQDPGKYEGKSLEHSVYNDFKEICLSGIEDKIHFYII